jgi:hypothetical protein
MPQPSTITMLITSCLIGGCVVQLPGNLDVGDETSTDDGDPMGDGDGDPMGDGDGDGDPMGDGDGEPEPLLASDGDGCQSAVDILLVVDNSGSMEVLQRRLAESIDALLVPLEDANVDWRLAITTTDVGNPWCPAGTTTPEAGAFQFQSCKDHLADFVFGGGAIDVQDVGCNDICPYPAGKLVTTPTTIAGDPQLASRPWMERIGGVSNLPQDIDPVSAALCLIPQGISGCGFEQPLEAMALAVQRATTPDQPETGFIRDDASLLVVVLTNEADCSHNKNFATIFEADGEKTFWSDPNTSFPTSAVCWNAGVTCTGQSPDYDDCMAANYDEFGNAAMPDDAVLHPVSRYTSLLNQIEQQKRAIDPGADVGMLVISGLGTDGQLQYADVGQTDPMYQDSFGIGPGCVGEVDNLIGAAPSAVPPVRLREVGAALSEESLASICEANYDEAFLHMQQRLLGACEGA